MKKISEIKNLIQQHSNNPLIVSEEIKDYMTELIDMVKEFNSSSVTSRDDFNTFNPRSKYNIDIKPQIDFNDNTVKNIHFTLKESIMGLESKVTFKTLFEYSTSSSFYQIDGSPGYELSGSRILADSNYRVTEEIKFHKDFYDNSRLFKQIVEDRMVTEFLKSEKSASNQEKFQALVENKSRMRSI